MTEWQPIETAPETRVAFLIAAVQGKSDAGWTGMARREFVTAGDVSAWHWSKPCGPILMFSPPLVLDGEKTFPAEPTHWMPLPEPPK